MARIKFLKASVEPIRERAAIEEKLRPLAEKKKKISADLPKIKAEIKELGEIVDEQKKAQSERYTAPR